MGLAEKNLGFQNCIFNSLPAVFVASESVPNDDLYEKSVNMVTTVMHLEGDIEEKAHYTTIHDSSNHLLKMSILDRNKVVKILTCTMFDSQNFDVYGRFCLMCILRCFCRRCYLKVTINCGY